MPGYQARKTSGPIPPPINPAPTSEAPAPYRVDVFSKERTERRLGALHEAIAYYVARGEFPESEDAVLGTTERFDRWLAEVDR